jgi:predicted small lipoprotein YifL
MRSLRTAAFVVLAAAALCPGVAGCGLKGSLALPEKSGNVVIRDKQTGGTQTSQPAPAKPAEPEKLPPPELPRSSSGSPR